MNRLDVRRGGHHSIAWEGPDGQQSPARVEIGSRGRRDRRVGFTVPTAIGAGQKESDEAPPRRGRRHHRQHRHHDQEHLVGREHHRPGVPGVPPVELPGQQHRQRGEEPGQRRRERSPRSRRRSPGRRRYIEVIDANIARNKTYTITISAKTPVRKAETLPIQHGRPPVERLQRDEQSDPEPARNRRHPRRWSTAARSPSPTQPANAASGAASPIPPSIRPATEGRGHGHDPQQRRGQVVRRDHQLAPQPASRRPVVGRRDLQRRARAFRPRRRSAR